MAKKQDAQAIVPGPVAETSVVPTTRSVVRVCPLVPQQGTPLHQCPTSLDLTSARGKACLINAMNPATISVRGNGSATIRMTDYLVYPVAEVDEESGEVKEFVRTVLIDRDGNTLVLTSPHAPNRIAELLGMYSREEWRAGIPVIVSERRSRREGRTYHDMRVALEG
jgi:hypothetical protein